MTRVEHRAGRGGGGCRDKQEKPGGKRWCVRQNNDQSYVSGTKHLKQQSRKSQGRPENDAWIREQEGDSIGRSGLELQMK
jgi:hypothetical protein